MKGIGDHSKHFGSMGKYYGVGTIGKYNMKNNLSVFEFLGNDIDNKEVQSLLSICGNDLTYLLNRMYTCLPMSTQCGFMVMTAMMYIMNEYKDQCKELLEVFNKNGIDNYKLSTSNWICQDAKTLCFHQELDSSYTMISVPWFDKNDFLLK